MVGIALFLKGIRFFSGLFCLTVEFHSLNGEGPWLCIFVYGPNDRHLKQSFWNEIHICIGGKDLPWVIYGDFNTIFSSSDKNKGIPNREDISHRLKLSKEI